MSNSKKSYWITGASSGIGRAVAIQLSFKNVCMILSGRNEVLLNEVAKVCVENGSSITVLPFDLGDQNSIDQAVKIILRKNISIYALYNFAGISQRSLVRETPLSIDRKIMEINFFGTVALTKLILPNMIQNGGGRIGVTTSIVGKFGFPYRSAYAASKHALHGFFESLRVENEHRGIKVSIIIPGRIQTNISLNALNKEGRAHNYMDKGQAKGMSAEKAAIRILKNLERNKKEILVGNRELLMVYIKRFIPSLYYFLSKRVK